MDDVKTQDQGGSSSTLQAFDKKIQKNSRLTILAFAVLFFVFNEVAAYALALSLVYVFPVLMVYGWSLNRTKSIEKYGDCIVVDKPTYIYEQMSKIGRFVNSTCPIYLIAVMGIFIYTFFSSTQSVPK